MNFLSLFIQRFIFIFHSHLQAAQLSHSLLLAAAERPHCSRSGYRALHKGISAVVVVGKESITGFVPAPGLAVFVLCFVLSSCVLSCC